MGGSKEHVQLYHELEKRGYTVEATAGNGSHLFVKWQGHVVATGSGSTGDFRAVKNLRAQVSRWERGMHELAEAATAAATRESLPVAGPVSGTCDTDGYWEDTHGKDHYWHCEEPAAGIVGGMSVCRAHMEELYEECCD
jgi:hypothetical protein